LEQEASVRLREENDKADDDKEWGRRAAGRRMSAGASAVGDRGIETRRRTLVEDRAVGSTFGPGSARDSGDVRVP
jgi:hypothetical protein